MGESGFAHAWDVELPKRGSCAMGGTRPKGCLHVTTEEHGSETFWVPAAVARSLAAKLKAGELDPASRAELLYQLRETSSKQAMQRVAALVNRRDYSQKELLDKLARDGYRQEVASEAVGRAVRTGLVDDGRFADVFVRTKVSAGWGMRRIADELRRRGVEVGELPDWPFAYLDPDDEATRALEAARRHHVSGRNRFEKLVRFLVGRGFPTGVAYDAARTVIEEGEEPVDG